MALLMATPIRAVKTGRIECKRARLPQQSLRTMSVRSVDRLPTRNVSAHSSTIHHGACQEAIATGAQSSRRGILVDGLASLITLNGMAALDAVASDGAVEIVDDSPGFGQLQAKKGDLVLVHYTGTVKESGDLFDSTKGDGLMYLNGGPGTFRPAIIQIGGAPVPGVPAGLMQGIEGMSVGGVRTFAVPPELGFGGQTTAGPFAVIPGNSVVTYQVEVLRLSRDGPDALMKGVTKCGQGGAGAQEAGCRDIVPVE